MTANIIKFPYSVSRRAHSRKPRRSKNGTPEQRARHAVAPAHGPTFCYFLQQFRAYLFQETQKGKTWYRALDELQAFCEEKEMSVAPD